MSELCDPGDMESEPHGFFFFCTDLRLLILYDVLQQSLKNSVIQMSKYWNGALILMSLLSSFYSNLISIPSDLSSIYRLFCQQFIKSVVVDDVERI